MVAFFSFFHTLTYTIMLYAKFSSTYPSSSNPENQVVRYTLSGSQSEIADYIAKNPKAVDAVTGGAIFNLTIDPILLVKITQLKDLWRFHKKVIST